jgi:type IV pilus biogenesis protein CpaD/CtpE
MNRIIVILVVALAAALAGCAQKETPPSSSLPDAGKMFDKQDVPNKASKGPAAN